MFKKGDIVTWTSQSQGHTLTKTGEIIMVVSPGSSVRNAAQVFSNHKLRFFPHMALPRKEESYFVSVSDGKTDKAMRSLYWPRVSSLKKV